MDFNLTKSQKDIIKAGNNFARKEFDCVAAREFDKDRNFPRKLHNKAAELGFTSIYFDEDCLGGGLGCFENALMSETLCRQDSTLGVAIMMSSFGAELLQHLGSESLKQKFLMPVAEGNWICGSVFPYQGNDAVEQNRAVPAVMEGGAWILNGRLSNVINGQNASFFCIPISAESENKSQNVTGYLVADRKATGLSIINTGEKTGIRSTNISDILFQSVEIPEHFFIGMPGQGNHQTTLFINLSYTLIASMALGIAQGALDMSLAYTRQREQFKKKLIEFQITRHKLADMATAIEQSRYLTYYAAWSCDQSKTNEAVTAMACQSSLVAALECSHEAIQLHGGYGFTAEYDVERYCRDARMLTSLCGNTHIVKDYIANKTAGNVKSSDK